MQSFANPEQLSQALKPFTDDEIREALGEIEMSAIWQKIEEIKRRRLERKVIRIEVRVGSMYDAAG